MKTLYVKVREWREFEHLTELPALEDLGELIDYTGFLKMSSGYNSETLSFPDAQGRAQGPGFNGNLQKYFAAVNSYDFKRRQFIGKNWQFCFFSQILAKFGIYSQNIMFHELR